MLNVQPKIDANVESQSDPQSGDTQGCGCKGNAKIRKTTLTEQQQNIADAIQRVKKRKNSTYKTQTRLFL